MPSIWRVRLDPVGGGHPRPGDPPVPIGVDHPQAVVASWLDDPRGSGTSRAHDAGNRPWALSPPSWGEAGDVALTVRLLDDALAGRLVTAASGGAQVRLGSRFWRVAAAPELVEGASWAALRTWSGEATWTVSFLSPAAFTHGRTTSPWPDPSALARGASRRWAVWSPESVPPLEGGRVAGIRVADLEGRGVTLDAGARVVTGFVGSVTYAGEGQEELAAFHALLAFARFAGVGAHTTVGLGTVDVAAGAATSPGTARESTGAGVTARRSAARR